MSMAMTKDDFKIQPPGAPESLAITARPTDHWNAWKAVQWAVENYGTAIELPAVEVLQVTVQHALEQVCKVANGSRGFGKLVFRHPFN